MTNTTEDILGCPKAGSRHPSGVEVMAFIEYIGPGGYAYMIIPVVLSFVMFLNFFDEAIYLFRLRKHWPTLMAKLWVLATYPFMSMLCVFGIFLPRSSPTIATGLSLYNAMAMMKFFDLIMLYYGGKKKMEKTLEGQQFPGNPPPCCFILGCEPVKMNVRTINLFQSLIYPVACFQIVMYFFMTVLWEEDAMKTSLAGLVSFLNFMVLASTAICVYAFVSINRASIEALQEFNTKPKFMCVQAMIFAHSIQGILLKVFDKGLGVPCNFPYPTVDQGFIVHIYVLIYEIFIVSIVARFLYRRDESGCRVRFPGVDYTGNGEGAITLVSYTPSPKAKHVFFHKEESQRSSGSSSQSNNRQQDLPYMTSPGITSVTSQTPLYSPSSPMTKHNGVLNV